MRLRLLPPDERAVRRYVETLWLPYHRELESTVDAHALADDVDLVASEVEFRRDWVEADGNRVWVAFDGDAASEADAGGSATREPGTGDDGARAGGTGGDDAGEEAVRPDAADAFARPELTAVGFVTTEVSASPSVFDVPDRLRVGDVYACEPYRGAGLAPELVRRAAADARERDCAELVLDVDVDNERAIAFYESLGFETVRRRLSRPVEEL